MGIPTQMDGRQTQMLRRLLRIWRDKQSHVEWCNRTYGTKHYETRKALDAEMDARLDVMTEIG